MSEYPVVNMELDDSEVKQLPRKLEASAGRAVRKVTLLTEGAAVLKAPVARFDEKKKGTNLMNSITSDVTGSGFDSVGTVKATASYAIYVHEGTGVYGPKKSPYTIEPKNKQALFWDGADHPVKRVTIRGMRARPFLKEAAEENFPKLKDLIFS